MKKQLITTICLILFAYFRSFPQELLSESGGRAGGMANTMATIHDSWGLFNNIAGISNQKNISPIIGFQDLFGIKAFRTISAGFVSPFRAGSIGIGIQKYGNSLLNKQKVSLGFAHELAGASLGFRGNLIQHHVEGWGNKIIPTFDCGVITQLSKKFWLGAQLFNISQTKISKDQEEVYPSFLTLGISYRPLDILMINLEAEKFIHQKPYLKFGLEYQISKALFIRTGINSETFKNYFGFGFCMKRLKFDYGLNNHAVLGLSHNLSMEFLLKKNSKPAN
ncbi:hypothetical protein [Flexithrix dorotheae]|uniref:hypothetical protein n=1 Tax=Flexithrix dorotheae TaxID=70993 RepID=UPI000362AF72|nr:hypothetical protein [Flexithrix dorotheae]